jgi:hypothetical protein
MLASFATDGRSMTTTNPTIVATRPMFLTTFRFTVRPSKVVQN